jgi:hypothetical protein
VVSLLLLWTLGAVVLPTQLPGRSPAGYWAMGLIGMLVFVALLRARDALDARAGHGGGGARDELVIAGIGFALGLCLTVVASTLGWSIARSGGSVLVAAACFYVATASLAIAALDLLPGSSPHGGRLLHAAIWLRTRDAVRATRVTFAVGEGMGLLLVSAGLWQLTGRQLLPALWLLTLGGMLLSARWRAALRNPGS